MLRAAAIFAGLFALVALLTALGVFVPADHALFRPHRHVPGYLNLLRPQAALPVIFLLCLRREFRWRSAALGLGAVLAVACVEVLGKLLIPQPAGELTSFVLHWRLVHSFPSGHAARGTLLAVLAAVRVRRIPFPLRWALRCLAAVLLAVVCWQLVACGMHYPSDVAGGVLAGAAIGSVAVAFAERKCAPAAD